MVLHIKNEKQCKKLKSRKARGKKQNCAQKCINAFKTGDTFKYYKSMPKLDIRDKIELCGKKMSKKNNNKIKSNKKKRIQEFKKYKEEQKKFNKTALITKEEDCENLLPKRRFKVKTINCAKECKNEFKKGNWYKKDMNPNYCGSGVKSRSKNKD